MDNDRTGGGDRPDPRPPPRSNQTPGFLAFSGLGLLNALCLAAGLVGGVFIDRALGTRPLFIFLVLFVGIAMGVLVTRAEWKRFF
jgi:hypothetical protein